MSIVKSIKNSGILIIEKVVLLAMSFVVGILLARLAGPEVFGQYAYLTSYLALFAPFCVMGINNIAVKYFVRYPSNSHHYLKAALKLRAIGALAALVIACFTVLLFEAEQDQRILLFLIICQSFSALQIIEYFNIARNNVLINAAVRLPVYLILGALKIYLIVKQASLNTILIVHGIEFIAVNLLYTLIYFKNKHHHSLINNNTSRTLVAFLSKGKWLFFSTIAAVIYLKIDQIMLLKLTSNEEVAYYAAAAKLSEFWYVFPILIANAFNAALVKAQHKNQEEYQALLLMLLRGLVAIAIVVCLLTIVFASHIIEILYGSEYLPSATILSIHIFACIFIFQRAILSKWIIIENYFHFSLTTQMLGALVNVLLNWWLIPIYGGIGAAWATVVSYMVASYLSLMFDRRSVVFMKLMTKAMLSWPLIVTRLPSKVVQNK